MQFSGPHAELPNGEDGSYGTAVHLSHAHDASMDVLVAYQQNGQYLHPDHGFPVRMLVPGWTAGRSVKWLTYIHVSADDSRNWYHLHDNKVGALAHSRRWRSSARAVALTGSSQL